MNPRAEAADDPPLHEFVAVDGRSLRHRITRGAGNAVVFVHGFGGSLESWQENYAALAAAGRTVAALDLPGHGESSTDVGSGSLDGLATAVLGYLDAMGLARVHLVGHSMGAAVCLVLADRVPQRVRSLTLISPAGIGQKINADFIRGFMTASSREQLEPLLGLLFADPAFVTPSLIEQMLRPKQRAGVAEALARIAGSRYPGTPSGGSLRDVAGRVPTLVIWGAEDAVIPPPAATEFAAPGVELHVLSGRGHMVQIEAAGEVNRLIGAFLER
jgi:pyruvate dehydrogenase E2 component (dihydrolipoamide acetyltransferase)